MANLTPELKERVLYEDDRIAILNAKCPDEHEIGVDFNSDKDPRAYCYIDRGILRDMAGRKDIKSFEASLNAMNPNFVYQLREIKMPLETIAWAFAKARIKELDDESEYFSSSKLKVRDLRSDY